MLIRQKLNFAPFLGPIGWIISCVAPTQRRSAGSTVYRLPFPLDASFATIETQQRAEYLFPNALLLPGLKSLMQYAARNPKPGAVNRLPLAARPQDEPQAIHHGTVGFSAASRSWLTLLLGKGLFGNSPPRAWHLTIIRALRVYGRLFHDVCRLF